MSLKNDNFCAIPLVIGYNPAFVCHLGVYLCGIIWQLFTCTDGFSPLAAQSFPHNLDKRIHSKKNDKHTHHQCGNENVADIPSTKIKNGKVYCMQSVKCHDTVCTHTVDLNTTDKDIHYMCGCAQAQLHTSPEDMPYINEHTLSLHRHTTHKHAHKLH